MITQIGIFSDLPFWMRHLSYFITTLALGVVWFVPLMYAIMAASAAYGAYASYQGAQEQKKAVKVQNRMAQAQMEYQREQNRLQLVETRRQSRIAALERIRVARIERAQARVRALASGVLPGASSSGMDIFTEQRQQQGFFSAYDIMAGQLRTEQNYGRMKEFSTQIGMFQDVYNRTLGNQAEFQGRASIAQGVASAASSVVSYQSSLSSKGTMDELIAALKQQK